MAIIIPEDLLRKVHQEMEFWWKIALILFLKISEVLLNHEPQKWNLLLGY